jgi:2-dehydropantoate 2-reductase
MPAVAAGIAPLLGPETAVVPAMNGIPWWFFDGFPQNGPDISFPKLDPGGALSAAIATERVMGCVVHMGSMVPEPGVIRHVADNRLILGEAAGKRTAGVTDRLTEFAAAFDGTTLSATVTDNLRQKSGSNFWGISILRRYRL